MVNHVGWHDTATPHADFAKRLLCQLNLAKPHPLRCVVGPMRHAFIFGLAIRSRCGTLRGRDFIAFFLPFGAIVFLLVYVFLINPDALTEVGRWLQDSEVGRWLQDFF
jgi:hypothetical protein